MGVCRPGFSCTTPCQCQSDLFEEFIFGGLTRKRQSVATGECICGNDVSTTTTIVGAATTTKAGATTTKAGTTTTTTKPGATTTTTTTTIVSNITINSPSMNSTTSGTTITTTNASTLNTTKFGNDIQVETIAPVFGGGENNMQQQEEDSMLSLLPIIGGAVGGALCCALTAVVAICFVRRRRKTSSTSDDVVLRRTDSLDGTRMSDLHEAMPEMASARMEASPLRSASSRTVSPNYAQINFAAPPATEDYAQLAMSGRAPPNNYNSPLTLPPPPPPGALSAPPDNYNKVPPLPDNYTTLASSQSGSDTAYRTITPPRSEAGGGSDVAPYSVIPNESNYTPLHMHN